MVCDIYGNKCFEDSMDNVDIEKSCDCPIECSSISYSFRAVREAFNKKTILLLTFVNKGGGLERASSIKKNHS